eukprot:6202784-Ditylum_brightwellii.AAC.1
MENAPLDKHQQKVIEAVLDAAFNEYTNSAIQEDQQYMLETKKSIIVIIQADIAFLTDVFPCHKKIIGKPTTVPVEI